ncbi:anthocyanidin 3-O-glucosyltransferase 4-like isoform X2 [Asparagus officinalis]|uniref:anthocyanidin 3-O-glucosyltransferase 4-like isoform X2 n=1 Tax=Asparagus officinalis TaxID=4686 RepID=UPI00098E2AA8|nr:anthocyanidin 3-O-glucosyltransferase 4-like isoform X2 [Asparagus officinalis]
MLPVSIQQSPVHSLSTTASNSTSSHSLLLSYRQTVVRSEPPDAIVSDLLLSWIAPVANELNIPRYAFPGTGCFPLSVELSILMNRAQIGSVDEFIVPGLPNKVYLTRFKLAETTLPGEKSKEFFDRARKVNLSTVDLVVNSFSDLEPAYAEYYQRVMGKRAWMVGPVSLCNQEPSDMVERGRGVIPPEAGQIFQFLDNKPTGSVLYVCFGSLCQFPLAQLKEIGFGLGTSNVPFIWVIREGQGGSHEEWMEDFEKSVDGRGMVVKGWAPQVGILSHMAVGGFMTHCGWGSVTETVSAGVPMLTWPLFAEQFYNEILVTEVAQVGLKIGAEVGFVWNQVEKGGVVVSGEKIKEKVIWFMGNEKQVEEVRKRAKMLGERARQAVGIEGSSYKNIQLLMEDMKQRSWRVSIKKELA